MVAPLVGVWARKRNERFFVRDIPLEGTPPFLVSGDFVVSAHLNYQFNSQNFERVLLDIFLEATPLLNT
jgi:hypothetical protein